MRSKSSIFAVLLSGVLALSIPISGNAAEIINLVSNPDFEMGTEGWRMGSLADGAAGTISIDKKEKPVVGSALLAQIDAVGNDGWEPEIHSSKFDVVQGKIYTIAFWAKTEKGQTRPLSVAFEQDVTYTGPGGQTFTLNDTWTEYNFTRTMNVNSPPQVVVHIQFNNTKGNNVWFAHFRVHEGQYVKEDLGQPKISVTPMGRLATAWGQIKNK